VIRPAKRSAELAKVEISIRTAELIVKDALQHIGEEAKVVAICPDCYDEKYVVTLGRANREAAFYLKERDCEEYPTISGEKVQGAIRRALLRLPK